MKDQELVQEIIKGIDVNARTYEAAMGISDHRAEECFTLASEYVTMCVLSCLGTGNVGKDMVKLLENAKTPNELLFIMSCLGSMLAGLVK